MTESVSEWLDNLKQGNPAAAQKLWQRYFEQLTRLARHKLGTTPRRVADEDDVVVMAFASFCRGVAVGRFPRLADRDDLWQVLLMLTQRTAVDQRRRELAEKRGGGELLGESAIGRPHQDQSDTAGVAQLAGNEPSPEFAIQVAEELELRFQALAIDPELRQIALDKVAGYTNAEISERLRIGVRSVERQLSIIRRIWNEDRKP